VRGSAGADAVERLAVLCDAFASGGEAHAGFRHQIAFICGVDEHASAVDGAVFHRDLGDALTGLGHGGEALVPARGDARFREHGVENGLGDFGFEIETSAGPAVVLGNTLVELPGEALDVGVAVVADVRRPEAAGGHAADVSVEYGECDGFSLARALHGGGDATGRAAVDAEVGFDDVGGQE
jgi:hypothetical protein